MRTGSSTNGSSRKVATAACLLGMALMISFAESVLPVFVPLPGFKPGFANVAVMAAFILSPFYAAAVQAARVIIMALLFGTPVSLVMSALGAAVSYLALLLLLKLRHPMSYIGVSVLSAAAHNGGQLLGAMLLTESPAALSYSPVLGISAAICGTLCGILMNHTSPVIIEYIHGKRQLSKNI